MKCLFLYNPNSGKRRIEKKLSYISARLSEQYAQVDIAATKSAEDMEARAREGADRYDAIIFSGGDGTFNLVLQGIGEHRVQLGYIPGGTTNDTARSLGIPRNIRGALNVILEGRSEALDVMRLNGERYAVYIAAAGAFTHATYATSPALKKKLGILAYAVEVLLHEMKLRVFPVRVNGSGSVTECDGVLLLAMNGRSVAGFRANAAGSMCDGKIELALIRQVRRPRFWQRMGAYGSIAAMMLAEGKGKNILRFSGSHFTIATEEEVVWDLDGEEGMRGDLTIEVLPRHMKLFVPRKKKI